MYKQNIDISPARNYSLVCVYIETNNTLMVYAMEAAHNSTDVSRLIRTCLLDCIIVRLVHA